MATVLVIVLAGGQLLQALGLLAGGAFAGKVYAHRTQEEMSPEEVQARLARWEEARRRASQGHASESEPQAQLRAQLAAMKPASPAEMERVKRQLDEMVAAESPQS